MFVCQEGCYNNPPILFCSLKACSLCNVCVSGGVLHTEITLFWGATIRIFSSFIHKKTPCSRESPHLLGAHQRRNIAHRSKVMPAQ